MSVVHQIEKLGEDNYDMRCMTMRSVLITADLWQVITEAKPVTATDAESAKWDTTVQKALACLILNIKPTQLMHIKACTTAADAWKKFREVHLPTGPVRKVQLYQKFLRVRMQEGDDVTQYVETFVDIVDKLAKLDIKINDELKVNMLLSSLPNSFENFVVAIETRDSLPLFETVKFKLIEEGVRKAEKYERESSVASVYAHTPAQTRKQQSKLRKANGSYNECEKRYSKQHFKGKCFCCNRVGHRASEYRKKATAQVEHSRKIEQSNCLMHVSVAKIRKHTWCIDSGATMHMCCDKDLFASFSEKYTLVKLAADKYVESPGVGTVILKTNNAKVEMHGVLYVPSLKINFVSVSKAAQKDYFITFGDKEARIKNKYGKIVLRVTQEGNLYSFTNHLENSAVHMLKDLSNVKKWHNRFGHLNFKV